MTITSAMQDYLAEAYRLGYYNGDAQPISTSALADVLGVSAPAVTRMVQRLRDAGYLDHEPYRGVILTDAGIREALRSIRRHRLVERFLTDVMAFGWHEVHDAADELGAVVSDSLVDRMDVMAGHPRRCPHGEPIPTVDGIMPRVVDSPLTEAAVNVPLVVSRVNSHDEEKLRYLDTLVLKTGASFQVIERAPFSGPIKLSIQGKEHFIGHELARTLRVCAPHEFELA